jgi:8-oxo-dGTP pyrophosphatase MutT (NUDIX family)
VSVAPENLLGDGGPLAKLAVTVVAVRPTVEGAFEVLLSERGRGAFARGLWVFPGGRVDAEDHHTTYVDEPSVRLLADRFGIAIGKASAILVGALRELAEEAAIVEPGPGARTLSPEAWARVRAGEYRYAPPSGPLFGLARWLPPKLEMRRFDTFFLVCEVPPGLDARADGDELLAHRWVTPAAALEAYARGALPLLPPTCRTLMELRAFATWPDLRAALEAHWPPTNAPVVRPAEPAEGEGVVTELASYTRPGLDGLARFAFRFDGERWLPL